MADYREINRANWNDRAPIHWASDDYGIQRFIEDPRHISQTVALDRDSVGDVGGKTLLHLQCHIGTDSLSWARLGAEVTGIDLSDASIDAARRLSAESGTPGRFLVSEIYDSPAALPGEQFDAVYTGVGALTWLPDVRRWAEVVAHFTKPGGTFFIRDGHPVMWSLDQERGDGQLSIIDTHFEIETPLVDDAGYTYTGPERLEHNQTHEWNHSLGQTVTALIDAGLQIEFLKEHTYVQWKALPSLLQGEDGLWRLPDRPERLPMMFSIKARKPA